MKRTAYSLTLFSLFCSAAILSAQPVLKTAAAGTRPEITFVRQPETLDGIDQYEVFICNRASSAVQVDPADVRVYAFQAGISTISHANLLKAVQSKNRRSPVYYAMLATEIGGWATSVVLGLDTTDAEGNHTGPIQIDSRVKALIPLGAAGLSFARYMIDREYAPVKLPDNLLPLFPFNIAADLCQSYAFYGVPSAP